MAVYKENRNENSIIKKLNGLLTLLEMKQPYFKATSKGFWSHPIEIRMTPDLIVKHLYIIKHIFTRYFSCFINSLLNSLLLQAAKKDSATADVC